MIEKAYDNFMEEAELFFVKPYINSESIKKAYTECLDIVYDITGSKDCGKGIIAYNPRYGQGKSFFFEVVQHRHRRMKGKNAFVWTTARELCEIYSSAGQKEDPTHKLSKFINVKNLFIDDIGDELRDGKERSHYGNKMNVLRWVLLRRYDLWQQKGWRTFGTTNISTQQMSDSYDGRVADRIKQMVHWYVFDFLNNKASFRQMSATRRLTELETGVNWKKFAKPMEKETVVDRVKFLNELVLENDEYLDSKDLMFWEMVMNFLVEKKLLKEEDLCDLDDQLIRVSEMKINDEVRMYETQRSKYAPVGQQKNQMKKAMKLINKGRIYDGAKALVGKKRFMELREKSYDFK